jgi:hypothetical protein
MNTIRSAFDFKTKLFGNLETQEFRSSGVQEFRSSGVQEFRSSGGALRMTARKSRMLLEFHSAKLTAPRF